ncbi:hypothetical protein JXL83_00680 [candidate division WOR-3 bacterium]|nr:hypothetical protein [candidate division WOR-3 bacterium]
MKIILSATFIFAVVASIFSIYSEGITDVVVEYSDPHLLILNAQVGSIEIGQKTAEGRLFSTVLIPCTHSSGAVGEPYIPVIRKIVEVPLGAQWSVTAWSGNQKQIYPDNQLYPVQPSQIKLMHSIIDFTIDESAYLPDRMFGEALVRVSDSGFIRGHRFITIEVFPVSYNPGKNEIIYRNDIEIVIDLRDSDLTSTIESYRRYDNHQSRKFLESFMLNFGAYGFGTKLPENPIGYLIIAPDEYLPYLEEFVDWKRQKGYFVTLTALSCVGKTANEIKLYIQNAYDYWAIPPQYVLLVGDDSIPAFTGTVTGTITDHPYSLMKGQDMMPDVWTGRWPVSSVVQLKAIVDKTLFYENPDLWNSDSSWCKRVVFMASTDNHTISEGSHRWVINNYLGPDNFICDTLWHYYGATTSQVSDAFNGGRCLAVFSGHGGVYAWSDGPPFTQTNVSNLTNINHYPIVQSYACTNGQWSASECFAETWIRAQGKGAVSFWASSPGSLWAEDDTLERWVFKGLYDLSLTSEKAFYDYGLLGVYTYGGTYVQPKYYYEGYNLFGDPSIDAWTGYPEALSVSHPATIPAGNQTVHVTVMKEGTPCQNALVALSDDNSVWAEYTDAAGTVDIQVSALNSVLLNLMVSGHNLHPYFGSIEVAGSSVEEQPSPCAWKMSVCGSERLKISYSIGNEVFVNLSVFDVSGREVRQLVDERQSAGDYIVNWNYNSGYYTSVSTGFYFIVLKAGEFRLTEKVLLIK